MILEMNEKSGSGRPVSNKSQYDGRLGMGPRLISANSFSGVDHQSRPG
jgi:hypothetical protein